MLDRLHLRRFKCFEELTLPTAPLTLLTGFNAAGKSTSLQPALLLAQTFRVGRDAVELPLNGELVRLGTPSEVLDERGDRTGRSFVIGAGLGEADARWQLSADARGFDAILPIQHVEFASPDGTKRLPHAAHADVPKDGAAIVDALREVVFLSAVRNGTPDAFPAREAIDPVHADVGVQGEYAAWWFERAMEDEVDRRRLHPGEQAITLRRQVNAWMSELFPGADANAARLDRTSLIRLELRTRITEAYRRPANIGYGLTYAFPIVVAALLAKEGQTIIVDSPEAHLHPRGQSAMGRLLSTFAASGVQFLVESHSDHVLNGVRRAVQSETIRPEHVAIHFFQPRSDEARAAAQVTSPDIDAAGNLSEWPEGFFDQSEQDLARLAGWA